MKKTLSFFACGFLIACGGGGDSSAPQTDERPISAPAPVTQAPSVVENSSFAGLLNGVRMDNGVSDLTFDARLGTAAQTHANDMYTNDYFSHSGHQGDEVWDRVADTGYNWDRVGENIAKGQTSQAEVMNDWVNSPTHQPNNINPEFEDFGLGRAGSGGDTRWVLVFGREASP